MTSQEMSKEFNIVFESVASMNAPGYTEYEKSVLLTQAQQDIAIEVAQKGLDSNDYARTVIGKLMTDYTGIVPSANTSLTLGNAYDVTLPAEFFYPYIEFAVTSTPTYQRVCKPVDYDSLYTTISNPYSNPYNDMYWRIFHNGKMIIITDGKTLTGLKGVYLTKPTPILTASTPAFTIDGVLNTATVDPILSPIVHREIVYRAAMKAYAAMKDQAGYQLQNAEQADN